MHEVADEAAEAVLSEAADEAERLSATGDDAAADEVVVEAVIETAAIEETADEVGLELVTDAAEREAELATAEHLEMEAERGDGDLPVDAWSAPSASEDDEAGSQAEAEAEAEPEPEAEPAAEPAPEPQVGSGEGAAPATDETEKGGGDPFRGPGDWYVVHTYADHRRPS